MTRAREWTEDEVRETLRLACIKAGSPEAWATEHEIGMVYLRQVLEDSRPVGFRILQALKLRRVVRYQEYGR